MLERLGAPFRGFGDWLARAVDATYRAFGRPGKWFQDFLNGSWLGHATHPVVTDLVVGGAAIVVVLDLAAMLLGADDLRTATVIVVGITTLSALSAVVTGLTDYKDTSPGDERNVAVLHGLVNIGGTAVFVISFAAHLAGADDLGRLFSLIGAVVFAFGSYVGGHLVFKYGFMVNYNAFSRGRRAPEFTAVIPVTEVPENTPVKAMLGPTALVVVRRGDLAYALKASCSHAGGQLDKGELVGDTIVCPSHFSAFRLADGAVRHGPASTRQVAYRARVENGQIEVQGPTG